LKRDGFFEGEVIEVFQRIRANGIMSHLIEKEVNIMKQDRPVLNVREGLKIESVQVSDKSEPLYCAWCSGIFDRRTMQRIGTMNDVHGCVSHGICPDCAAKQRALYC
jgi:hypothetical protein